MFLAVNGASPGADSVRSFNVSQDKQQCKPKRRSSNASASSAAYSQADSAEMGVIYSSSHSSNSRCDLRDSSEMNNRIHLSNVDLSSDNEDYSNPRRSNRAAQQAAANNIIRIEMVSNKNQQIRAKGDKQVELDPNAVINYSSTEGKSAKNHHVPAAIFTQGSPAQKALEQTYLF